MPQSLSSWCKANNLAKGSVHAKAKALDIDTSKGLSDDAIRHLSEAFNLHQPAQPPVETEIITGNHRVVGELSLMPNSVDLGQLRQGSELTVFTTDAMAAVDQALTMADELMEAIEDDTAFQMQQLQRTQQANNKLRRKADALKHKQQRYAIESRMIGIAQGKEATELQQTMADLKHLGLGGSESS